MEKPVNYLSTSSFMDGLQLLPFDGPKTPSPLPKSKILQEADQLLCKAEKEFTLAEAKITDHLSSAKSSARCSNLLSARRTMTDLQLNSTKGSIIKDTSLYNSPKGSYQVPNNSPASFSKLQDKDKYMKTNGEQKNIKPKSCPHHVNTIISNHQVQQSKELTYHQRDDLDKSRDLPLFSMFYNQQSIIEKRTGNKEEDNTLRAVFKSDARTISSDTVLSRRDVETNTDAEDTGPSNLTSARHTPNSSIISMKTNKREEEDQSCGVLTRKQLKVQKMPSVNIRPEFTVQTGPKINIVPRSKALYKPKRQNTELFDVVYSSTAISMGNHSDYICERHVFPSGKLIPGNEGDTFRDRYTVDNISLEEKKTFLLNLIKSLSDKIDNQPNRGKNCCRLRSSLPLLASILNKVQVDCVKCVDVVSRQVDTLVQLMKEELRSSKELSEDHCCQLDETVQYQIVEFELLQDCNPNQQLGTVKEFKHKESNKISKAPKKTVSFENVESECKIATSFENNKTVTEKKIVKVSSGKNNILKNRIALKNRPLISPLQRFEATSTASGPEKSKSNNMSKKLQTCSLINGIKTLSKKQTRIENALDDNRTNTVVGQVISNIASRKMLSKEDSLVKNINNEPNANVAYTVIDKKEDATDFDRWIQERCLKIQKIHDELNNIVSTSMEKVIETKSGETQSRTSSNKQLELCIGEEDSKGEKSKKGLDSKEEEGDLTSESAQESSQYYVEDFEDDVEQDDGDDGGEEVDGDNSLKNNVEEVLEADTPTEDSHNQTVAEAEVSYSSLSKTSKAIDDEKFDSSAVQKENVSLEKQETDNLLAENSEDQNQIPSTSALPKEHFLKGDSVNLVEDQNPLNKEKQHEPTKVSIATSPINYYLPAEANTLLKPVLSEKKNVATSPINEFQQSKSRVRSTMMQTENIHHGNFVNVMKEPNTETNVDESLVVPSLKLTPTPIENVVQLSLGNSGKHSLALKTNSTNRGMELFVQLPNLAEEVTQTEKLVEIDSSEPQEEGSKQISGTASQQINVQRERQSRLLVEDNASTSRASEARHLEDEAELAGMHFYKNINKNTIREIVEPTVSEVLKKMKNSELKTAKSISSNIDERNNLAAKETSIPELLKPNIILQTRHGMWKKCDDNPIFGFINSEFTKHTVDSSNQTETEKHNACVQVTDSLAVSVSDRAMSPYKTDEIASNKGRSYIEMLHPLPAPMGRVASSGTCSSLFQSSSARSSSQTSTSSKSSTRKSNVNFDEERLSEGEVIPEICRCITGEVCSICVPKLDLSFGELKTKKRNRKKSNSFKSSLESDDRTANSDSKTDFLTRVPLHLEPRPNPPFETFLAKESKRESSSKSHHTKEFIDQSEARKPSFKTFNEVASSVLSELNSENLQGRKSTIGKHVSSSLKNTGSCSLDNQREYFSSSSSDRSGKSINGGSSSSSSSKENAVKYKSKMKEPLMIKLPVASPKIDAIIEDLDTPDLSISSYQTSVTSVSVDNLPATLHSSSSGEVDIS